MTGWADFFRDLFIGIPIVFFGTALSVGGVEEATTLFILSAICTLGLALLLFWIPICWFVGFLTRTVITAAIGSRFAK